MWTQTKQNTCSWINEATGGPLKLMDKFTYRGSSASSAENDINMRLVKAAWTAIDRISVIWKSDLWDKIKRSFFPNSGRINTAIWMHNVDAKYIEKNLDGNYTRMLRAVLNNTPQNSSCTATDQLDEPDMRDIAGGTRKWCIPVDPFTWWSKVWTTS